MIERISSSFRYGTQRSFQSAWGDFFLGYLKVQKIPHVEVSVPVIGDYLGLCCTLAEREYRTIAVSKCALKHPLLWAGDLDLRVRFLLTSWERNSKILNFNFFPPLKKGKIPKGCLDQVLEFLNSDKNEPMDEVSDHLLTQIALFLISPCFK